jgi:hypothetical protein
MFWMQLEVAVQRIVLALLIALGAESSHAADISVSASKKVQVEYGRPEGGWPLNKQFSLPFQLVPIGPSERLPGDLKVEVDLRMPAHRHGANIVPVVRREAEGKYRVSGLLMHMSGDWEIRLTLTAGVYVDQVIISAQVE